MVEKNSLLTSRVHQEVRKAKTNSKYHRKNLDRLADSCKRSSVNQMAASSRLPRSSHGFLLSPTFQTYLVKLI